MLIGAFCRNRTDNRVPQRLGATDLLYLYFYASLRPVVKEQRLNCQPDMGNIEK
jgi:hypothetical protein